MGEERSKKYQRPLIKPKLNHEHHHHPFHFNSHSYLFKHFIYNNCPLSSPQKNQKDREYQDENYWTNWSEEDIPTLEQHYKNGWEEPWNAPTWDNWGINPKELGDPEPEIPAPAQKN